MLPTYLSSAIIPIPYPPYTEHSHIVFCIQSLNDDDDDDDDDPGRLEDDERPPGDLRPGVCPACLPPRPHGALSARPRRLLLSLDKMKIKINVQI